MDDRRDQIIDIIKREFIGPDPLNIPELRQENGEEILSSDPPRIRYIAGILFPQRTTENDNTPDDDMEIVDSDDEVDMTQKKHEKKTGRREYLADAEELINLSNAYQQSAISITVAINNIDRISVVVSAGTYSKIEYKDAQTEKTHYKYPRKSLRWNNDGNDLELPDDTKGIIKYKIVTDQGATNLCFAITYRYTYGDFSIYTFTLENAKVNNGDSIKDEDCYFQVEFNLISTMGFEPLPEKKKVNSADKDYVSNKLLYRNIKSYAIGHGCAAEWKEEGNSVKEIKTSIFPSYEIKPIVPSSIEGVSLEMLNLSDYSNRIKIISELTLLCDKYDNWIHNLTLEVQNVEDKGTAIRHIDNCKKCLARMREGVELLSIDDDILFAFQLMNRAMLLQQLHYNLPLQKWETNDNGELVLENPVSVLPDILNQDTWYNSDAKVYGKWRPFQIAFVLINLKSMANKKCDDRSIVDLIWFPTGGGKTEAYLGLSAYTIFIRRLNNPFDSGTTILMRYTLRLLTAQQYERASAMICACEMIRQEFEEKLGKSRITIGLWVGKETTPNDMSSAIKAYNALYKGENNNESNPFVILKCPWCGAQMGIISVSKDKRFTPGYKKIKKGQKLSLVFRCSNSEFGCSFSKNGNELPLYIFDDDIYEKTPTLLLGTVDKFAMLPFRSKAQSLFGIKDGKRISAPDLIIQDELHLISGPLGSMVGHYETMINELCSYTEDNTRISPKIIASTATISRADEQCHALYACKKENVMQFPPSGLDAGDSFFAVEDKKAAGRRYVGILASGSSSNATTAIRLYASLLYAAKAIKVNNEMERDGYWTNLGYFNSIRELGQTETWIRADIDEYLHVIYKRRYEDKDPNYKNNRRYIYRDEELTSRISSDKIPESLQDLSIKYPTSENEKRPVDICLATNMISVGVDVPRLGLMTVTGQPKTTSEYIQATSRVGRDKSAPGLVFVIYNPGKPRDKSHYEHFITYHSKVYSNVEPTSVTPFSAPLRERALHAIIIGILRLIGDDNYNENPPTFPDKDLRIRIRSIIEKRLKDVDKDEMNETLKQIDYIFDSWERWEPLKYYDFDGGDELPLMFPSGIVRNEAWGEHRGFPTPTSMRSVDAACEAFVLENGYIREEE